MAAPAAAGALVWHAQKPEGATEEAVVASAHRPWLLVLARHRWRLCAHEDNKIGPIILPLCAEWNFIFIFVAP
jgi:hypothetical protein